MRKRRLYRAERLLPNLCCRSAFTNQHVLPTGVQTPLPGDSRGAMDLCPRGNDCGEMETMRAVVQRVSGASVRVDGETIGAIGIGLLVLLGVAHEDSESDADYLADKISGLRIFEDADGKMNRSVIDVEGAVLAVSQFTLFGDVRRGKRPSFDAAARPEHAIKLYDYFVTRVRAVGLRCETGKFQAMMDVESVNQGPVTILLDSK